MAIKASSLVYKDDDFQNNMFVMEGQFSSFVVLTLNIGSTGN
jgi:hypothetical protein